MGSKLGSRGDRAPSVEIAAEQRACFERDGFVVFDRPVVSPEEVAELRQLLDPLFERFDDFPDSVAHDLGGPRIRGATPLVAELEYVTILVPELRRTRAVRRCQEVASSLYGRSVPMSFSHAIYKPAWSTGVTAWHQDAGYDPSGRKTVAVWLALQETDRTNGCMRYVRGSQAAGRMTHNDLPGRHGRRVEAPIDDALIVDAVLPLGGMSVHREYNLHCTGPNETGEPRRSLILEFAPPINSADRVRTAVHHAKIRRLRRQLAKPKTAIPAF